MLQGSAHVVEISCCVIDNDNHVRILVLSWVRAIVGLWII
jgi:hypothetical protein